MKTESRKTLYLLIAVIVVIVVVGVLFFSQRSGDTKNSGVETETLKPEFVGMNMSAEEINNLSVEKSLSYDNLRTYTRRSKTVAYYLGEPASVFVSTSEVRTDRNRRMKFTNYSLSFGGVLQSSLLYVVGNTKYYFIPEGGWFKDESSGDLWGGNATDKILAQQAVMAEMKVKDLGFEEIDGRLCRVLEVTPKNKEILKQLYDRVYVDLPSALADNMTGVVTDLYSKEWIDVETLILKKYKTVLYFLGKDGRQLVMEQEAGFYDINTDVPMSLPKDAENAVEIVYVDSSSAVETVDETTWKPN